MGSFWLLLRLRRRQIQTLISMSTLMPRIAKEENLLKLGEEFWPQTPVETMVTGHPCPPPPIKCHSHCMPHCLPTCKPPTCLLNVPMPTPQMEPKTGNEHEGCRL